MRLCWNGGNEFHGALTYYFVNQVRAMGKSVTYAVVMDYVQGLVTSRFPAQHPKLQGALASNVLFGIESQASSLYALVTPLSGSEVSIDTGAALGATKGSTYDVYPPGTSIGSTPSAASIAAIELTDVQASSSTGKITSGGNIQANSRARERSHNYQDFKSYVYYQPVRASVALGALRAKLAGLTNLQTVQNEGDCDLRISENNGQIHIDGCRYPFKSPPIAVGTTQTERVAAVNHAQDQVVHWVKWLNLIVLSNLQIDRPDISISASPVPSNRDGVFYSDGKVHITVSNKSARDVYMAVLDFQNDGAIDEVYPGISGRGSQLLLAGHDLTVDLPLSIPDNMNSDHDVLKLIATTEDRDFRIFELESVKGVNTRDKGMSDPLGQLFLQASFGQSRAVERFIAPDSWATSQVAFDIKKR